MLERKILVIGKTDSILVKAFCLSLEKAGYFVERFDPEREEPGADALRYPVWFGYLDNATLENRAVQKRIASLVGEYRPLLLLLGTEDEIRKAEECLSDVPVHKAFRKPTPFWEIQSEISKIMIGTEESSDRILIVDDDVTVGHAVKAYLDQQYTAIYINNGRDALEFLEKNRVDLILLDIKMPGMDGFDVIAQLRTISGCETVPVIYLSGVGEVGGEIKGLAAGATDFLRKPIIPEVLRLRVHHALQLYHLTHQLEQEVERKTAEVRRQSELIQQMTLQITEAMSGAIDAKDSYTRGHSGRVARYSMEIAERYGYTGEKLQQVYITGILHDVGKIGVPNSIINKNGKLTDEEYATMKKHPVIGEQILSNITVVPEIATAARWHHERYDGKGYPDGLLGEDIPEIARIVGVADAYDAMSSKRSYRDPMPQAKVREQIEQGIGTQFSPEFARIMLEMIDEDTDYEMREQD